MNEQGNPGQRNYSHLAAVCVGGIIVVMAVSLGVGYWALGEVAGSDFALEFAIVRSLQAFGVLLVVYLIVVWAYVMLTRK